MTLAMVIEAFEFKCKSNTRITKVSIGLYRGLYYEQFLAELRYCN